MDEKLQNVNDLARELEFKLLQEIRESEGKKKVGLAKTVSALERARQTFAGTVAYLAKS